MTKADQARPQRRQPAHRLAVARRIGSEERFRLVQARKTGDRVDVGEDIAADQGAIRLPPEGDMTGRMSRHVQHGESGDVVALMQPAIDWVGWSEKGRL